MGLVDLLGRLRPAKLQIPEGKPSYGLGSTGKVSASNVHTVGDVCTISYFLVVAS